MADIGDGRDAPGFKLFGTTILVEIKQGKEKKTVTAGVGLEKRSDKTIPCPRCKSIETKFCYFNNYNVKQPRHFCKGCKRYWTAGGTLRNVPVGSGRRRPKPSCHGSIGFSNDCFFDSVGLDKFELEQWLIAASKGSFWHVLPAKRRSNASAGQIC